MTEVISKYSIDGERIRYHIFRIDDGYNDNSDLRYSIDYNGMSRILSHVLSKCIMENDGSVIHLKYHNHILFEVRKHILYLVANYEINDVRLLLKLCEDNRNHLFLFFKDNLAMTIRNCYSYGLNYDEEEEYIGLFDIEK